MKIINIMKFSILIPLLMGLVACLGKNHQTKEDAFAKMMLIPIKDMNKEITLSLPVMEKGIYVPKLGDIIDLTLVNHSKELIVFPSDYGVRMYTYNDKDEIWIEINNLANYVPPGNRQVSPKGDGIPGQIIISAIPDLPISSYPVDLRVVVIGIIYQHGIATENQVGAYTDITLQP